MYGEMEKCFTINQVCEILQISRPTFYKRVKEGNIKVVTCGKTTRIAQSEIKRIMRGK